MLTPDASIGYNTHRLSCASVRTCFGDQDSQSTNLGFPNTARKRRGVREIQDGMASKKMTLLCLPFWES